MQQEQLIEGVLPSTQPLAGWAQRRVPGALCMVQLVARCCSSS